ncbi:MAG: response regulator [Granulosicoccus sp.]|nr:response regulator [Granulosicoccus sp.]
MRTPPCILAVDDNPHNLEILEMRLRASEYDVITAVDGEEAIAKVYSELPDLVLLDIMMPKIDGLTACRELKSDSSLPFIPIILVTAKADSRDIVAGLEAGADEYLTKPIDQTGLVARVKSMLRIKELHDNVQSQAAELAAWNETLEQKVADQLNELKRADRLKRFFSPQVAELITSQSSDELLASRRGEVTAVFCDLRGFTAFSEIAEPEQVMGVLGEYHDNVGELIFRHEGTIEHFAGDGIMILFNDPLPCEDHELRAVKMALEIRERAQHLLNNWRSRDHHLGLGIGIAQGYATLGQIGFEGRFEYSSIGPVINLASRLCDAAQDGQILISQRVFTGVQDQIDAENLGELEFKGFHQSSRAYNVVDLRH